MGCEHIYTHTTHVFNPLQPHSASTPTEIRPARVELNQSGTIARSQQTFFVCVLLLFCCIFLFVCFLILFFAAPAVRTPRRVGRRWAPCQEMMSWPASPLTLVCVFDTLVLFRCDCAVPDATARVCMCACGLHLWRVCVCVWEDPSLCVCSWRDCPAAAVKPAWIQAAAAAVGVASPTYKRYCKD